MAQADIEERGKSRIPTTLQAVFLASNRGNDVYKPPPEQVAFKSFQCQPPSSQSAVIQPTWERIRQFGRRLTFGISYATPKNTEETKHHKSDEKPTSTPVPIPRSIVIETEKKKNSSSPRKAKRYPSMSPQLYLDSMLRNRGYSTEKVTTLSTAFRNDSTELQMASYNLYLITVAKSEDLEGLKDLLRAGLSPNPCNEHGESLVHTVCRRNLPKVLELLIECGATMKVSDDYGRTPLHDACWSNSSAFEIVEIIMREIESSHYLFHMVDARGCTPLDYIRKEHWAEWIEYLQFKKDDFWPASGDKDRPEFLQKAPNSCPVPDPSNALPLDIAKLVAAGRMQPDEARLLVEDGEGEYDDDDEDEGSEYSSDDDDCDESSQSSDDNSASELEEMADILEIMAMPKKQGSCLQKSQNPFADLSHGEILSQIHSHSRDILIEW